MAQNLQQIKKRIKTSQNIAQIAKAMEMIAASKIRKAQIAVEKHQPYADKIWTIVQRILRDDDLQDFKSIFAAKGGGKKLIFVITPDKGLCGGLVTNIFKKLNSYASKDDYIIALGKKAVKHVAKYNYNVLASFNIGTTFPKYEDIFPIIEIAKKFYMSGEAETISIIYSYFKNMLVQEAVSTQILPVEEDKEYKECGTDYMFEPSPKKVLDDIMPYYFEVEFYNALMNAYASEQAARMTAMRNAKDNAHEISASLTNIYNRSRQERITSEILDLANGQI
jgi:ATP synthase, F1 gamma subunit